MLSTSPKLTFYSGVNTAFPYKSASSCNVASDKKKKFNFVIYQLNKYVWCFLSTCHHQWVEAFWQRNSLYCSCDVSFSWEWFVESVLDPAQNTCCNLQRDGMVHSIPTQIPSLMAVVLSKWSARIFVWVWPPANQGLPVTCNWNWTQSGWGQYNGSIELMVWWNEGPCGFDGGLKLKNSL